MFGYKLVKSDSLVLSKEDCSIILKLYTNYINSILYDASKTSDHPLVLHVSRSLNIQDDVTTDRLIYIIRLKIRGFTSDNIYEVVRSINYLCSTSYYSNI